MISRIVALGAAAELSAIAVAVEKEQPIEVYSQGPITSALQITNAVNTVTRDGWRWIVNAHKDDGKRYIVQSDELLSAFLELEAPLP